jgi:hypothetical protein
MEEYLEGRLVLSATVECRLCERKVDWMTPRLLATRATAEAALV